MTAPINPAIVREGESLHFNLFDLRSLCRKWYWRGRHNFDASRARDRNGQLYMPATDEAELAKRHNAIVQDFVKGSEERAKQGRAPTLEIMIDLSELEDERTRPVEVRP